MVNELYIFIVDEKNVKNRIKIINVKFDYDACQ